VGVQADQVGHHRDRKAGAVPAPVNQQVVHVVRKFARTGKARDDVVDDARKARGQGVRLRIVGQRGEPLLSLDDERLITVPGGPATRFPRHAAAQVRAIRQGRHGCMFGSWRTSALSGVDLIGSM
jgi:hypothetical protein